MTTKEFIVLLVAMLGALAAVFWVSWLLLGPAPEASLWLR